MSKYLITYDLRIPGKNYSQLISEIKSIDPSAISPCLSVWIVSSNLTPIQIVNTLHALDATDKLFAIELIANWWSRGLPVEVSNALKLKL